MKNEQLEEFGDNESDSEEDPEVQANTVSSQESESDELDLGSNEQPNTDETQALKAEIVELKGAIIEKDQRISELEMEVSKLKEKIKYYEEEAANLFKSGTGEMADFSEQTNYPY